MVMGVAIIPILASARSPLLAWREPIYILAGFAGVVGLSLLLVQAGLMSGILPGLTARRTRQAHRWVGSALLCAILIHVAGLWVTSPPDVVDALLFTSPTPFSAWGVLAMWASFAIALLVIFRPKLQLRHRVWQRYHLALATIIAVGTILHALLIEGTMETVSKVIICLTVLSLMIKILAGRFFASK